jgi:sirohydrochlorin ferrochelatase
MKQLLIVAHGSRREASNEEVRVLAAQVAKHLQLSADKVQVAFLELAAPSLATALNDCFTRGVNEVSVLPYFLSSGTHVINDVPREIAAVQTTWPDKVIKVLPHIGAAHSMVNLIASSYR